MELINKPYNISWNGEHEFTITSWDKTIDTKITFYNPSDARNKATGKGSLKYKRGLMVECYMHRNVRIEEDQGLPYGSLALKDKEAGLFE